MTPAAWATFADVTGPVVSCATPDEIDAALLAATYILYLATGSQWPGTQTDSIRPPGAKLCHCSVGRPGCSPVAEIKLPGYPVVGITEVWVDGEVVPDTEYRIDDRRWLVRLDEAGDRRNDGWPCCQRYDWELSERDTFGVVYTWGAGPPDIGKRSAISLGTQLLYATQPAMHDKCSLPIGVMRAVTRQGVSIDLASTVDVRSCGIPELTMWLKAEEDAARGKSGGGRVIDPYAASLGRRNRRPGLPTGS